MKMNIKLFTNYKIDIDGGGKKKKKKSHCNMATEELSAARQSAKIGLNDTEF